MLKMFQIRLTLVWYVDVFWKATWEKEKGVYNNWIYDHGIN